MTEGHPIDPIAATLGILGFAVLGFLSNRIPIALVATGVALALFFTGVLSLPEALAGFGDPTVLFIASLFVVCESLDATGVTAWAGQKMIAQAGSRHTALIVLISLLVAVLTALISVNGAVAALLPLMLLIGRRVLPDRSGSPMPPDLTWLATELHQQYTVALDADALLGPLRGVTEVVVPPRSPLIGTHVFPGMTTPSGDLVILGARRGDEDLLGENVQLRAGDALLLRGSWDDLERHTQGRELLAVDSASTLRRSVPLARGWKRAVIVLLAMVVLLATGLVPPAVAGLLAAGALILTRTVR